MPSPAWPLQIYLVHGPNILDSYAVLFFIGSFTTKLSTTEHPFFFTPVVFLELFFCSYPVAYWTPSDLGSSSSNFISFCLFHTLHEVLEARILEWISIHFPSKPRFVIASLSNAKLLHHDKAVIMLSFWLAFCDCDFHSGVCGIVALASFVCPLMDEAKRLVQVSWW